MMARAGKLALLAGVGLVALLAATSFVDGDKAQARRPAPAVAPVRIEPLSHSGRYRLKQVLAFHGPGDARRMVPFNDTVMGGSSTGEFVFDEDHGVFLGVLSREGSGGGFASVRSVPTMANLGGFAGLVVRAKGDGRRYQMDLREADLIRGVAWSVEISPPANEWVEIAIPFAAFEARRRNRPAPEAGPVDPSRITSIGFRTRGDRPGPFELRVSEVSAWAPRTWDL